MTKKSRIWGLVQDRLSPVFALHVRFSFLIWWKFYKGVDSEPSAVGQKRTVLPFVDV